MSYFICNKCNGTFDPNYHFCPICDGGEVARLSQQLTEVKAERDALQKLLIDKIIERAIPYPTKEEHD